MSRKTEPYLLLAPAFLLIGGFMLYPLITAVGLSLRKYQLTDPLNTPFIGLTHYQILLDDPFFWQSLYNSILWVVCSLAGQFTAGFVLALLLNNARFRARGLYQAVVFTPWAVSGFLIALIWAWMLNGEFGVVNDLLLRAGLVDQKIGFLSREDTALFSCVLANIWFGITFFAVMLYAGLQAIPPTFYEAADMDGVSSWQRFSRITVPMLWPTITVTLMLRAIWVFNWADLIWVMTRGGPGGASQTLALYVYQKGFLGLDFGYAAALGVALTIISAVFTLIWLRVGRMHEEGTLL